MNKKKPEPPKISEMLEMTGFMAGGLPADKAAQAARSERYQRESRIPQIEPSPKAYRREYNYLRSEAGIDQQNA